MIKTSITLSSPVHKALKELSMERKLSMSKFAEIAFTVFIMLEKHSPDTINKLENAIDGQQQSLFDIINKPADRKSKLK
jgi:predicted transcriptional regulator